VTLVSYAISPAVVSLQIELAYFPLALFPIVETFYKNWEPFTELSLTAMHVCSFHMCNEVRVEASMTYII